jgi:hypothetical protein
VFVPNNATVGFGVGVEVTILATATYIVCVLPSAVAKIVCPIGFLPWIPTNGGSATLYKIASDAWFVGGANLQAVRYGYFAGGYSSAASTLIDRIVFATGITAAFTATLSGVRYGAAKTSVNDSVQYGYYAGGNNGAATAITDRVVLSTGTTSANTASNLSQARQYLAGVSGRTPTGTTYGYFAGGYSGAAVATADRIVFSTGVTSANTASNLSQARQYVAGLGDCFATGYFAGGISGASTYVATADKIVFSTGVTSANTASNLSTVRANPASISNGTTYGYWMGGTSASSSYVATTDRITFSTGVTAASTVSNLSVAKDALAGVSDGATYGYAAGGHTTGGAMSATTDRIVFSTGVTAANTVSNLSVARSDLTGLSEGAI